MFVANLPQQPQWNTRIWNMAMHKSLIDKPQQTDPGLFVRFVLGASLVPRPSPAPVFDRLQYAKISLVPRPSIT